MTPTAILELHRGFVLRPDSPAAQVPLFTSWEKAAEHLRDHVLTAPECAAWALVLEDNAPLPPVEDASSRQMLVTQAWNTRGTAVQELFALYAQAIRQASHDAAVLTWHASLGSVTAALGTAGVAFLIVGQTLVTAYLPGQGHAASISQAPYQESPLPRERGMRPQNNRHPREDRRHRQRQNDWSRSEWLYYGVFRPAIQFIRSRYHSCRDAGGQPLRYDLALLNGVLPPMSELTYALWRERRLLCGHGDST